MNTLRRSLRHNTKGFGTIELLLILVVVAVLAGAGAYLYYRDHKAKTTGSTSQSSNNSSQSNNPNPAPNSGNVVASTDGKVQITLPNTWEVINGPNNAQVITTGGSSNCFTDTDPNPCVYTAYFAPKSYSTTQLWTLSVEKTTRTPQQVIESLIGQSQQANVIAQSSSPINGYATYYIEYKHPNTDVYYAIANNGYVVLFINGQLNDQSDPNATLNSASSPFLADFTSIVKSIKLNV